jgi:ribose transport system permease protein
MNAKGAFSRLGRTSPGLPGYCLLLLAVALSLAVQGPGFFSGWNIRSVFSGNTPLVLACMAQMVAILAGGIDLSVGSTMALANTLAITLTNRYGWPIPAGWGAAVLAGTAVGALNGVVIGCIRVPPILTTLCTLSLVQGLALLVLPKPGGQVPPEVYRLYAGSILGVPTGAWVLAAMSGLWLFVDARPAGVHLRAVGGNERSAYANGIRPARVKLLAYSLAGFYAGVAGICLTALTAAGDPRIGVAFTLRSVAGAVLGGVLFGSGWGSVGGTVAGGLFLALVNNIVFFALNRLVDLIPGYVPSPYTQNLVSGVIIVAALAGSGFTFAWQERARRDARAVEEDVVGAGD